MSAVGLTKARQRALETWKRGGCVQLRMLTSLMDDGLAQYVAGEPLTPRGQAALAAPRMTAAELDVLSRLAQCRRRGVALWVHDGQNKRGYQSCEAKNWAKHGDITDAGLTALNNMRAAMGSAEYKDNMP